MNSPQRILITGASGDIGKALIDKLSETNCVIGAQYFQTGIEGNEGKKGAVQPFKADCTKKEDICNLVDLFYKKFGGIDVLVHLVGGISSPVHWRELSTEDWNYDLNVNLTSGFNLIQAAYQYLCKSPSGKIVLTSTASVKKGGGAMSLAYGVAKAGVESLTKFFARDMAEYGVLVNCIAPGFIDTKFHTMRMKRTSLELDNRATFVPLKRPGTPEEIAKLISFLISEDNTFITGEIIRIDGGDFI
jgi:3-oxoacyl-[acyl-carrier protein] reductase